MTQEEKKLLFKDLCARLPYGVKVFHECSSNNGVDTIGGYYTYTGNKFYLNESEYWAEVDELKPYLRPMSSMTAEEKDNLQSLHNIISDENYGDGYSPSAWNAITEWEDYCNAHHFDYRGLIEKGFALEAKEGMYKTE